MKNVLSGILLILPFVFSCKKGELPVQKHQTGTAVSNTVEMGSDYRYQLYFDLGTNSIVGQNLKSAWDLGFETGESGFHIILNGSKFMFARNTGLTDFSAVTDTLGFEVNKKWDAPSGDLDSTAIGDWTVDMPVYVINLGTDETGAKGFKKVQFLAYSTSSYTIRFANLNGSDEHVLDVPKNNSCNFSFVSLDDAGSLVDIEPPKTDWDLHFTQYTETFYEPEFMPYLVTGCLMNTYETHVYKLTGVNFDDISYDDAVNAEFSASVNGIGYDWKTYTTSYQTNPDYVYIILDQDGVYYKLHFTDFYNQSGVKGYPQFEFAVL